MIVAVQRNGKTFYAHTAWANDMVGTDFSLTEFGGALCVGSFIDSSSSETTDYSKYTWIMLDSGAAMADEEAAEDETGTTSELQDVYEQLESIQAMAERNATNIEGTQLTSDEGLGNINLLSGTNQGAAGWTGGGTLSGVSDPVYSDDTNDSVNTLHAVMLASDTLSFPATQLFDYFDANGEENTYTLSFDFKCSNPAATMDMTVSNALDFGSIDMADYEEADADADGAWLRYEATGELAATYTTGPFEISYTGIADDTVDIANLKIEAGAMATPWKASLEEIEGVANTALSRANAVAQHFWYDAEGAHVADATQEEYNQDPTNSGGNTLITSGGLEVRNGTDTLASFGSSGAQIGKDGEANIRQDENGMTVTDEYGQVLMFAGMDVNPNLEDTTQSLTLMGAGVTAGLSIELVPLIKNGTTVTIKYYEGGVTERTLSESYYEIDYASSAINITQTISNTSYGLSIQYTTNGKAPIFTLGTRSAHSVNGVGHNSFSVGENNTIWGDNAATIGTGLYALVSNSLHVGAYNEGSDFTLFSVGHGTANTQKNAFEVRTDGTARVESDPVYDNDVATKRYVDSGQGFAGEYTQLLSQTLTSTLTNYTLSDSVNNYKFLCFKMRNGQNVDYRTIPVSLFKLITSSASAGNLMDVYTQIGGTGRRVMLRYSNTTTIGASCSINSGIALQVYGIK